MNDATAQKIVAFGQIMHRLTPVGAYERLVEALRGSGAERGRFAGLPGAGSILGKYTPGKQLVPSDRHCSRAVRILCGGEPGSHQSRQGSRSQS